MYTKGGVPMLQRAYVEITNICNLRCDFCPGTRRPLRAMRVSEFERIARELRPYTRHIYLHVMGEPLLHPELDKILDSCCALDFRVHLTTNGVLLPDRLDLLLAAPALYRLSISLHSYEANHVQQTLESYVRDCCRCAAALAARRLEGEDRPVTCVLRLWNRGGRDTLNDRIAAVLEDCTGRPLHQLERDARGNRRLLPHVYIEAADRFHWPGDPAYDGPDAQFCYGLRRQAPWCPAAWTARGACPWATSCTRAWRTSCRAPVPSASSVVSTAAAPPRSSAAAAATPRGSTSDLQKYIDLLYCIKKGCQIVYQKCHENRKYLYQTGCQTGCHIAAVV